jgi:SPP1 family predicted phage head-tail adaptor
MQAGKLDRKIILQRFTETRDEYNEPVKAWVVLATRSASYEPLSDGEKFRASETAADASARFVIRWSNATASLNPKDQLIFEGQVWQIVRVKEVGRREGQEITVAARADG